MKISTKTLDVIKNFNDFLSTQDTNQRKMRFTPDLIEFKISEIIGFYFCEKEGNSGFQDLVISDSRRFIELAKIIGFDNADFKDPFIYLKKGDRKIKFHTSRGDLVKAIDKDVIDMFNREVDSGNLLVEPFVLDMGELKEFFDMASTLGYKGLLIESKNNTIKLISYDESRIDVGYDELNLGIKTDNKISMHFSIDLFKKLAKSSYKVYLHPDLIKLENLDIEGLVYFLSPKNV